MELQRIIRLDQTQTYKQTRQHDKKRKNKQREIERRRKGIEFRKRKHLGGRAHVSRA